VRRRASRKRRRRPGGARSAGLPCRCDEAACRRLGASCTAGSKRARLRGAKACEGTSARAARGGPARMRAELPSRGVHLAEPFIPEFSAGRSRVAALGLRKFVWPVATTLLLVVAAGENGGYYPTTWNWSALVVAWVAAVVLSVRDAVRLGRLELATIGAPFALVGWVALSGRWTDSLPATLRGAAPDRRSPLAVLAAAA